MCKFTLGVPTVTVCHRCFSAVTAVTPDESGRMSPLRAARGRVPRA